MSKPVALMVALILLLVFQIPSVKQKFYAQIPFLSSNLINSHPPKDQHNRIQMALLLDTSNSMDGLIEQTKSQLWKMVDELANTSKNGETPLIEIALYQYGHSDLSISNGYVKQIVPLTSDLDLISEKLFQLKTNGGEEYCGYVLRNAIQELQWSDNPDNLKIMVVAGNEPFNQGPISFRESCKKGQENNIIINTIFCGDYEKGVRTFWKEGAMLANGQYLNINHNDKVVHVETPYDDKIFELNNQLNKTYLWYGKEGEKLSNRQQTQDANAALYGKSNVRTRASFKSKNSYNNATWDLVDAVEKDKSILSSSKALPKKMQPMNTDERRRYVTEKKDERKNIQEKIRSLNQKAEDYIASKRSEHAAKQTLDNVMISTIKKQAEAKRFKFE